MYWYPHPQALFTAEESCRTCFCRCWESNMPFSERHRHFKNWYYLFMCIFVSQLTINKYTYLFKDMLVSFMCILGYNIQYQSIGITFFILIGIPIRKPCLRFKSLAAGVFVVVEKATCLFRNVTVIAKTDTICSCLYWLVN